MVKNATSPTGRLTPLNLKPEKKLEPEREDGIGGNLSFREFV